MIYTIIGGGSTFTAGIVKSIALRKDELEVDEIGNGRKRWPLSCAGSWTRI